MWIEKDDLLRSSENIGGGKLLTLHHLPTDVKMEVTIDKDGDPVGDILVYAVDGNGATIDSYTYNSAIDLEFWNATDKFESIIADMMGVSESSQTDEDDPKEKPKEVNAIPQVGDYVEVKGKYGVVVSVDDETRGVKINPMSKEEVMTILREQKDQLIADTKNIGFRAKGGNIEIDDIAVHLVSKMMGVELDVKNFVDYNVDTDNVIILEVKPPQQKGGDKEKGEPPEETEKNKKDPFEDDEQDNEKDSDKDGENDDGKDGGNGDDKDGDDKDGDDKGGDDSGKDDDGDDGKSRDSELQKSLDKFNKGEIKEESERGLMSDFDDDEQDDAIFGGGGSDDVFGGGSDDLKDDDLGIGTDLLDRVAKELSVDKSNLSGFNEWSALARGVGWSKVAKSLGTSVSELKEKLKVAVKQNK